MSLMSLMLVSQQAQAGLFKSIVKPLAIGAVGGYVGAKVANKNNDSNYVTYVFQEEPAKIQEEPAKPKPVNTVKNTGETYVLLEINREIPNVCSQCKIDSDSYLTCLCHLPVKSYVSFLGAYVTVSRNNYRFKVADYKILENHISVNGGYYILPK